MIKPRNVTKRPTSQEKEEKRHNGRITEIDECADKSRYLEFRHVIVDAVGEIINCCETARQERPPPPVIILEVQPKTTRK